FAHHIISVNGILGYIIRYYGTFQQMDLPQLAAQFYQLPKSSRVLWKRYPWKIYFQKLLVFLAVRWRMQNRIDIIQNVNGGKGGFVIILQLLIIVGKTHIAVFLLRYKGQAQFLRYLVYDCCIEVWGSFGCLVNGLLGACFGVEVK